MQGAAPPGPRQGRREAVNSSSVDLAERRFLEAASDIADAPGFARPPAPPRNAGDALSAPATNVALPKETGETVRHLRTLGGRFAGMAARELARGTPFNFVPVFLATGALAYFAASREPPLHLLLAACGVAGIAVFALRRWTGAQLAAWAVLFVFLGAVFAKLETLDAGTKMLGAEVTTRLTGRIVATDHLANGRVRLTLDIVSTERPKLRYAPDRVRITARAIAADVRAGDIVAGAARLLPPLGATRPGGYDFAFESYFDGVGATGFFLGEPKRVELSGEPDFEDRFNAVVEDARDRLAARIRSHIGGAEGEIAAALIAGVRAGIPEDVNEALRRTGLAHVLSISGLHMALVAATIIGSLRFVFACFPRFASRHPVRKYAASAALIALAIYLFVSGNQVAAQRSFIMIAIMLIAWLSDHAALTMRNLALAATVVLVVSPHEVVGPSFQMSFAATAALIGAYAAWSQRERHGAGRVPGVRHPALRALRLVFFYVAGLAATSLLAGAATTIFGAHHFQRVSPLSLFANLAAMPIVSVLVMPFAVLGLLLMPVGLDGVAFAVMGEGLRLMNAVAAWFSARSPLDAIGLVAPGAVICMTLALIFATLLTTWLRLIAVPFALLGSVLLFFPPRPEIFVSDDGKLVAMRTSSGTVAVNRNRPNAFTLDGWMRALNSETSVKPLKVDDAAFDALSSSSIAQAGGDGGRFRCTENSCITSSASGQILITSSAEMARKACETARIVVVDDATFDGRCADPHALVITRRELARRGSAMIDGNNSVVFAIREPYRPWHEHRRFSREARGLAPWQPDRSRKPDKTSADATANDGKSGTAIAVPQGTAPKPGSDPE